MRKVAILIMVVLFASVASSEELSTDLLSDNEDIVGGVSVDSERRAVNISLMGSNGWMLKSCQIYTGESDPPVTDDGDPDLSEFGYDFTVSSPTLNYNFSFKLLGAGEYPITLHTAIRCEHVLEDLQGNELTTIAWAEGQNEFEGEMGGCWFSWDILNPGHYE